MKVIRAMKTYITDIKNLIVHGVIGIGILLAAYFLPVSAPIRIGILLLVVAGNTLRMRIAKSKRVDDSTEGETI